MILNLKNKIFVHERVEECLMKRLKVPHHCIVALLTFVCNVLQCYNDDLEYLITPSMSMRDKCQVMPAYNRYVIKNVRAHLCK